MRCARTSTSFALVALALAGCAGSDSEPEVEEVRIWQRPVVATPTLDASAFLQRPRPSAYVLGAGDTLNIGILDLLAIDQKYTEQVEIDSEGGIALPVVGRVQASGRTLSEVRRSIADHLTARIMEDPQVTVTIQEYRSKEIAVLGAVKQPGAVALRSNISSVLGAIALAGGLAEKTSLKARVLRGSAVEDGRPPQIDVDLEALQAGDLSQNVTMYPGDVLQVLPAERYFVTGWVTNPGEYPYERGTTIMEAVAISGGMVSPDASPDLTRIHRPGQPEILVDYEAIVEGEAQDILLAPGDVVEVRQGFWRGVGLFVGRFMQKGVVFAYNLASLID
jgi:polysaccharide biosynthesis/export protein